MKKIQSLWGGVKRILTLFGLYAKHDLLFLLRDPKYSLLFVFHDSLANLAGISGVFLLTARFDGVGDMNRYEVLFMLGYTVAISGLLNLFGGGNNIHISRRVGRGQLEHMMIQPVPFSAQLLTEGFIPFTGLGPLAIGAGLLWYAADKLDITLTWWWAASLPALLLLSLTVLVAQSYLYSSLAFYAPVAAEEISTHVIDCSTALSQFPLSVMPGPLRALLMTGFPVGLLGWFPSMALLGKPVFLARIWIFPVLAAVFFFAARWAFRRGMDYYFKTGANRYSDAGHRC